MGLFSIPKLPTLGDIVKQVTNSANDVVNFGYGYNPGNGKFGGKGSFIDWANEGLGQLNGANAQRHALNVAGDAANAAQTQQNLLISQQNELKHQQDVSASSGAAAIRATAQARSGQSFFANSTPQAYGPKLGADTTNFLGV